MNRTFYPATNTRGQALINEDALMMQLGGPKSFNKNSPTYNLMAIHQVKNIEDSGLMGPEIIDACLKFQKDIDGYKKINH